MDMFRNTPKDSPTGFVKTPRQMPENQIQSIFFYIALLIKYGTHYSHKNKTT